MNLLSIIKDTVISYDKNYFYKIVAVITKE